MDKYFIVQCPCKRSDPHEHKISIPDISKFSPTSSRGLIQKENIKEFRYSCGKPEHECVVEIDIVNGVQKKSECMDCK